MYPQTLSGTFQHLEPSDNIHIALVTTTSSLIEILQISAESDSHHHYHGSVGCRSHRPPSQEVIAIEDGYMNVV